MDNIYSTSIQGTSIQFLETLYILDNSKNIETIQSRIEFLETIIDSLRKLNYHPDYQFYIQLSIDNYNVRYFNRNPDETDLIRLSNPESFDIETYCINALINGLKRFFEEQLAEMEMFKKGSSKEKRISKIIQNVLSVKNYFQIKYSESSSYPLGMEEIEKIVNKIKEIHETI